MSTLLIRHGTIVTAAQSFEADVFIQDEQIRTIGKDLLCEADREIDASGKLLLPGGIDVHTHLDMPLGDIASVDNFRSGTIAAACGGTTTIIDYAAHQHGESMEAGLETWHNKAAGQAVIDYGFHMTLSEFTGRTLADMERMVEQGVTSFKVFTAYPGRMMIDDAAIFQILKRSEELGSLVCAHAENGHVIEVLRREALAAGKISPRYHALTRPPAGEGEAVQRLVTLAELADAQIYIVHVSCEDALLRIVEGRSKGLPIYAETCPQYLFLSADNYDSADFEGAKYVMSPPLREAFHQKALWRGIQNRSFQTIGTDHCPFYFHGHKDRGRDDFTKIPNGAPGIETRLSLMYTGGVCSGRISPNHFVDLVSTAPAKLFGLYPKKGTIAPGSDADLLIVDPSKDRLISAATHHSAVDYSLYEGMRVRGIPELVTLRGKVIVEHGSFIGDEGGGRFILRVPAL
ncbi:dihydropyrimidinase [candidate division KSB3 bacterium]|uniref:Dihydropyrimidinase n=1 Tax=candidate division KSB3 bacterium TaxID=2044937 RepID=A0A2G6E558_9BACT|nr:MAG: dihydropyrimidinase [candidate division KSB3 bacterium]PIE29691.1 MAG: dihydropyrimidinase [candidate division KSB3 bacterium]